MEPSELIAETNSLLKQLLDLDTKRQLQRERATEEFKKFRTTGFDPESRRTQLKETMERSKLSIIENHERDQLHRQQVMAELTRQSELLERIAEKLGA